MRRAVGQVLHVEVAERRIHDAVALRRHVHPAQLLDVEGGRGHRRGHAQRGRDLARVLHVEGDLGGAALERIDAPQLALRPHDDGLAVGRPCESGIHALHRPRLLHVALEMAPHGRLLARGQVLQEQRALVAHPAHEGQLRAVGRRHRPHRTALARDEGFGAAVVQVEALDVEDLAVRILVVFELVAVRDVLRVVHVAPVRRERGLAQVLLPVRLLVQLHALAAAAGVVQPDLARAQRARAGEVLARRDVLAVGRPGRRVEQAEVFLRDGLGVGAVGVHHPHVVAAARIADVGDAPAVRRPARLHLERDGMGQRHGLAAGDRQRVEVAQQVEHQALAVGADVHRHPGAGARVDVDRGLRPGRMVDVPLRLVGRLGVRGRGIGGERVEAEKGCGREQRETARSHGLDWRLVATGKGGWP